MPRLANTKRLLSFYKRRGGKAMHARDRYGGHWAVRIQGQSSSNPAIGVRSLNQDTPPEYGRIDHRNGKRFPGGTRSRETLKARFAEAKQDDRVKTGQPRCAQVPKKRNTSRRAPKQGMDCSASDVARANEAAIRDAARQISDVTQIAWNWCHLIAHSMKGEDAEGNIVCGTSYNNSEQLIIENTLSRYRHEGFEVRVQAATLDEEGLVGDVIRYQIGSQHLRYQTYLDCLASRKPTGIHQDMIRTNLAKWLNNCLSELMPIRGRDYYPVKSESDLERRVRQIIRGR